MNSKRNVRKTPERRRAFPKELRSVMRPCWTPEFGGVASLSRLGGGPSASRTAVWPSCTECGAKMAFVGQIDPKDAPAGSAMAALPSLLQVFGCANSCEFGSEDAEVVARLVRPARARRTVPAPAGTASTAERLIRSWMVREDVPGVLEGNDLGIFGAAADMLEGHFVERTKLGGYPIWPHGVDYPACAKCHKPTELLLMVLGTDAPIADNAAVYVTSCRDHPTALETYAIAPP